MELDAVFVFFAPRNIAVSKTPTLCLLLYILTHLKFVRTMDLDIGP